MKRVVRKPVLSPGLLKKHLAIIMAMAGLVAPAIAGDEDASNSPPLRLCADPANLPFSSDGATPGVHLELAAALAKKLDRSFEPVWSLTYFGKRNLRATLLAGKCDFFVGLPDDKDFMGPRVIFSKPVFSVGYALVTPKAAKAEIRKGQRIGVQFDSGPQNVLAPRDDITTATFLDPEEAMAALAAGQIDAAAIWGPTASYVNHMKYADAYRVTPVSGPGLQWQAAIGFAKKDQDLRDASDRALDGMADVIARTLAKYEFPRATPVALTVEETPQAAAPEKHTEAAPSDVATASVKLVAAGASDAVKPITGPAAVAAGKEVFNSTCAHCHGPDGIQADRHIDLRRLQHKYDNDMDEVFMKTVHQGRADKGMPNWTGVFSEEQFAQILAYLHTIQSTE